jgi:IMP dehydrogenase
MGSLGAMEESAAARERYQQSDGGKNTLIPEGIEGMVPYKGELASVILQYVGGLRRGMGYIGAKNITELHRKARFIRVTNAGIVEAHPHGVVITKEAPNYPGR